MVHKGTKKLVTDRLILRKFILEDAHQMFTNWASNPLTSRYLSWEAHTSEEETKELLRSWISSYEEQCTYNWVVQLKDSQEIIGSIMVVKQKEEFQTCEIGYSYGPKYWGKGYATEALREVCCYLLNEIEYRLVEAYHVSGNPASGRVMEKVGMKKDGVLRQRQVDKNTGAIYDLIGYSVVRGEL